MFKRVVAQSIAISVLLFMASYGSFADESVIVPPAQYTSLGVGINGIKSWSSAHPFLDLMKQSGDWQGWTGTKDGDFDIDRHGWIRQLKPGQHASLKFSKLPSDVTPAFTRYIVSFKGEGRLRYTLATKLIKHLGPQKDLIELGRDTNVLEIIETNPKNYIREISIVPEEHYDSFTRGAIFNPKWLDVVRPFRALRYMDWLKINNSSLVNWSDRPLLEDRSWVDKGVPIEMVAALSQELGVDAWINLPHAANDQYFSETAKLLSQQMPKSSELIVEFSNEVWNGVFDQATYAREKEVSDIGKVMGSNGMQWYGSRAAKMCEIFKAEFKTPNLRCAAAIHTAVKGREQFALLCPGYAKGNSKPCYQRGFDLLAVTTYFTAGLSGDDVKSDGHKQLLYKWAAAGDSGLTAAFEQLESGKSFREIPKWQSYLGVANELEQSLVYWRESAKKHGLGLVSYEGGQHITPGRLFANNAKMLAFYHSLNRDPRMEKIYTGYLNAWKTFGGGLAMHYLEMAPSSKYGDFGAKTDYSESPAHKWNALRDFSTRTPCWWEGCKN